MLKKFILCCVLLVTFTHCVQPVKTVKIHPNCPEIPATTFEKVGLDAKAGALQFGKLVTVGELTVKSDPQIISGISQSVRDDQITDALICAARERGELKTDEQIDYAWKVARYFRTNPTPADAMEFYKQFPFPVDSGKHLSQASQSPSISQHSEGANSPNIVGDRNVVIITPPSEAKLDEIRDLLRQRGYPYDPNKLLQKYPLGYAIFDLTYMNQVIPYEGLSVLKNYEMDWSTVKVIQNTKDRIALQLSDLKRKDGTVGIKDVMTGGWKKVGYLGCGMIGTETENLAVCGEILAIREDGIVFLVNLMQFPPMPK